MVIGYVDRRGQDRLLEYVRAKIMATAFRRHRKRKAGWRDKCLASVRVMNRLTQHNLKGMY